MFSSKHCHARFKSNKALSFESITKYSMFCTKSFHPALPCTLQAKGNTLPLTVSLRNRCFFINYLHPSIITMVRRCSVNFTHVLAYRCCLHMLLIVKLSRLLFSLSLYGQVTRTIHYHLVALCITRWLRLVDF